MVGPREAISGCGRVRDHIDLCGDDEVVLRKSLDRVGGEPDADEFVVTQREVRVVTFLLGDSGDAVQERHRLGEVAELEDPFDPDLGFGVLVGVVVLHPGGEQSPVRNLPMELRDPFVGERRCRFCACDARLGSEITLGSCSHQSSLLRLSAYLRVLKQKYRLLSRRTDFLSFQLYPFVIPGRDPESRTVKPNDFRSVFFVFLDSGSEAGMIKEGAGMTIKVGRNDKEGVCHDRGSPPTYPVVPNPPRLAAVVSSTTSCNSHFTTGVTIACATRSPRVTVTGVSVKL